RYDYETRYETVPVGRPGPQRGAAGNMILGGIIGAAVGNQIGSGDGRRAATVAGAIIGSAVGHDAAARRSGQRYAEREYTESRPYEVERCDVRYDEEYEERIDGYRVTYVYNGREHTTRLPYDPGDRIRVRVNVRPDDDY
ncbi:MAG TPA: glycine zipper 2TM domain-containing protein, partial [Steroidobacteraceae bacterium]|nr:glycine zipper 2TM domain-containing protein [Steroidobacteraceae bacterium]